MSEEPDPEEARERQRKHQQHMRQLEFNNSGELSREFIEEMIDTSKLTGKTVDLLQSYCSRQWILGNMNEAEVHDQKWKVKAMQLKFFALFPPEESAIQGRLRAFLKDEKQGELHSLSGPERTEIDSLFDTIEKAVVPRGREGFERKQINTEVRESRTKSDIESQGNSSSGGVLGGLF